MNDPGTKFYAKLMLFGEYSLIVGSRALTIPVRDFYGSLVFPEGQTLADRAMAEGSNNQLWSYFRFLSEPGKTPSVQTGDFLTARNLIQDLLNLDGYRRDLEKGLYFNATIPSGYGLGSSGALVAAIYHRYARTPFEGEAGGRVSGQLLGLKNLFASMESFFHGTSSGIDPLSCYLGKTLLLGSRDGIQTLDLKPFPPDFPGGFFLLDTRISGKTGPLVQGFLDKYLDPGFREFMASQYIPANNECISLLIENQAAGLLSLLCKISGFQLEHFKEMIPSTMVKPWEHGLNTGLYSLKLCGSGGGGYLLGLAKDYEPARKALGSLKMIPLAMPVN